MTELQNDRQDENNMPTFFDLGGKKTPPPPKKKNPL